MKFKHFLIGTCVMIAGACSKKEGTPNTVFAVEENKSVVKWKGSAPDHFHLGSFDVKGSLEVTGQNKLSGGSFVIPITSIKNFDLNEPDRTALLNHLKTEDFFNLAIYPEAKFRITKIEDYSGQGTDVITGANTLITGSFTMIGQTNSISFPARITHINDTIRAEALLKIDRLKWKMNKFSDPAAPGLYILPDVNLELDVRAVRD